MERNRELWAHTTVRVGSVKRTVRDFPCPTVPGGKSRGQLFFRSARIKQREDCVFWGEIEKQRTKVSYLGYLVEIKYLSVPWLKVLILPVNKIIPLTKWRRQSWSGTQNLFDTIQVVNSHGFLKLLSSRIDKRAANAICLIYIFYHSSSKAVQLRYWVWVGKAAKLLSVAFAGSIWKVKESLERLLLRHINVTFTYYFQDILLK